jgi:hypothetical protein
MNIRNMEQQIVTWKLKILYGCHPYQLNMLPLKPPNILVKQGILFGKTACFIAVRDEMINDTVAEKCMLSGKAD